MKQFTAKEAYICAALLLLSPLTEAQIPTSPRDAESLAFDELVRRLKAKNINFTERPLMADYGAFGVSVEVKIPAKSASSGGDGLFVLAVPILEVPITELLGDDAEGWFLDGSLSWCVELALSLIDTLSSAPLPFDTLVYFATDNWPAISAITGGNAYPYAGFQALLDGLEGWEETVIVYCDSHVTGGEAPSALTILRGMGAAAPPLGLVETFMRLCAESGIPCFFDSDTAGDRLPGESLDEASDREIIYVIGAATAPALQAAARDGKKIMTDEASALFRRYAAEILRGGENKDEADRNYAYIDFGSRGIFIPELALVLFTLLGLVFEVAMFFCLCYAAKSRHKRVLMPVFAVFILLTALSLFMLYKNSGLYLPARMKATDPETRGVVAATAGAEAGTATNDGQYFTVNLESTRFLDHRIVRINIEARLPPLRYRLLFTKQAQENSSENLSYFIYDAPMPYNSDGKRIEFILGSYPPNPLSIEIALPLNLDGEFSIEGFFPGNLCVIKTFPVPAAL
jgi:hypothetical protein